jgi:hypothetical protein
MQFPDRSDSIAFYTDLVRRSSAQGDISTVRGAYAALVESWKQQNINSGGALEDGLNAVKREYSDFVKTDPLYQEIKDAAVQAIRERSGMLQTEMYTTLFRFPKEDVQYALYFAADHGTIIRTKKGRTYALSLASNASA